MPLLALPKRGLVKSEKYIRYIYNNWGKGLQTEIHSNKQMLIKNDRLTRKRRKVKKQ